MLVTALLYAPSARGAFVYEDQNDLEAFFITPDVSRIWVKPFRSLTSFTQSASGLLSPRDPWGYHAGNVAVHVVNVGLVYALASTVLPAWSAVAGAAMFALHPVQTESVAYISSRADLVMTLGVLLALLGVSRGSWIETVFGLLVAFGGKETAIGAVPFVAWWAWRSGRLSSHLVVGCGLMGLIAAVTLARWYPLAWDVERAGVQMAAMTRLVGLVAVPVGLTIDHDWSAITPALSAGAWCLWLVGAAYAWRYRWSFATVAYVGVVATVLPRVVVPLAEGLHEHHLYLPMVGLSVWAASLTRGMHGIPHD